MDDGVFLQSVTTPRPYSPGLGSYRNESHHNSNLTFLSVQTNVHMLHTSTSAQEDQHENYTFFSVAAIFMEAGIVLTTMQFHWNRGVNWV